MSMLSLIYFFPARSYVKYHLGFVRMKMNAPKSTCPHITTIGDYTKEDIIEKQEVSVFI